MMNRPTHRSPSQSRKRQLIIAAALTAAVLAAVSNLWVNRARAQTGFGIFVVNSTADTTDTEGCDAANCTLREAITASNAAGGTGHIQFAQGLTGSIVLKTPLPTITAGVQITGPGADKLTVRNSNSIFTRILAVAAGAKVSINGLTISRGGPSSDSFGEGGAGIYNKGTLSVASCVFVNNGGSVNGGGIRNDGKLTVSDTTFDTNGNSLKGGGIWNFGMASVTNCTFTRGGVAEGGGIYNESGGDLTVSGSNITGNRESANGAGIYNVGHAVISDTTIASNKSVFFASSNPEGRGGGIFNAAAASLDLIDSTVSANEGNEGSGIYNLGTLTAINSTISSNQGGGIFNSGALRLTNVTVTANSSKTDGAGLLTSTPAEIQNSIIAGNTVKSSSDINGTISSLGHNLIGNTQGATGFAATDLLNKDPRLGPLADNGGPTRTHSLLGGSPAIDKATCAAAPAQDQRGLFRFDFPEIANADGGCDIGAFEAQPVPTISINSASVTEGDSGTTDMTFTVSIARPAATIVSVNFATENFTATAGDDYFKTVGQINFLPGNTSVSFKIPVRGDTMNELDEVFLVRLSNPQGGVIGDAVGVGLILDDDPLPSLSIGDVKVAEGDSGATPALFNVSLSAPSGKVVTVDYNTSQGTATAGSDYVTTSGTLVFPPGVTEQTISVPVLGDTLPEPDETFTVNLSKPTNATLSRAQATATIRSDDSSGTVQFNAATYTVAESGGAATVTVTRTGGTGSASVSYSAGPAGTATGGSTCGSGSDYINTSGTLTWASGDTQPKTFTVPICDDNSAEGNETITLALDSPAGSAALGAQKTATLVIEDDDAAALRLSASAYTVNEDEPHALITVNRTGDTTGAATVDYATTDKAGLTPCAVYDGNASARCDYAVTVGRLRFAPGESSRTINIPIVNDSYAEGPETFSLTLSNASGATLGSPAAATITITDNDPGGSANPLAGDEFFVRQLYIDFLGREPETEGMVGWLKVLNRCKVAADCDRIAVALGFLRSREFNERGYFVYRLYATALGRAPHYDEFITDLARVSGFLSDSDLEANKAEFINAFMQRQEFRERYDPAADASAFVSLLESTSGVSLKDRETLIANLSAGKLTRADVLRAVALSPEINARYSNEAFVVMSYFGFLRRDPDSLYQNWISILNQTNDARSIVGGFLNSLELRQRFGQ